MALKNLEAEALMQDARAMQAEGVRLMDAGDWRNGSEKGWLGVRNAAEALVWAATGVHNLTCADIYAGLSNLAREQGGEYVALRNLWGHFIHHLFYCAFYDGIYDDDLHGFVRDVADYIRRAEALAG